jgi:2-succinyl-5-enolpyruvyl-6-hydroxy-3-cyclohexene-1-carboxylate synthase
VSVATDPSGSAPDHADVQATFCATLVDEWVRGGVPAAVVCPGSRSTPLALALLNDGRIPVHVRLDERSAAFLALGIGLAAGHPAVLCTTSGTAAVELHPAVVEAHLSRVPLLVCTADRPPELHEVGAPQTIDQTWLYGSAVRWYLDPGVPEYQTQGIWRSLAARMIAEAVTGPFGPGPVHINLPFREPLLGTPRPCPPGRLAGAPWHRVERPTSARDASCFETEAFPQVSGHPRGILVVGGGAGDPAVIWELADALGWPVLADPRSRCRVERDGVVAAADSILRDPVVAATLRPDLVVRLGDPWASKTLVGWLDTAGGSGVPQIQVDPHWQWADPGRQVAHRIVADPTAWCVAARAGIGEDYEADPTWRRRWTAAEQAAQECIEAFLESRGELTEPGVARTVLRVAAGRATVVTSSSMPVRDVEWFSPPLDNPPRVVSNRGANGIDGVVSTALGVALGGDHPVVAVVGDLAFLHDLTALVRPDGPDVACTVVVVDNSGGGIFSFLPHTAGLPAETFDTLFGTPQHPDVEDAARGLGVSARTVERIEHFEQALADGISGGRLSVLRVRVPDRATNVALHDELLDALRAAVRRTVAG